jgi:hypothetical protein
MTASVVVSLGRIVSVVASTVTEKNCRDLFCHSVLRAEKLSVGSQNVYLKPKFGNRDI